MDLFRQGPGPGCEAFGERGAVSPDVALLVVDPE
jgi:hypothetical protein